MKSGQLRSGSRLPWRRFSNSSSPVGKEFAQPLIEKRKDVDSGNATVAELQIYYLQKDASSWVKNSTDLL